MNGVIISVGAELTTGQCVDTNAAWLASQLTEQGVDVAEHVTVGDDRGRIKDALRAALNTSNIVIVSGGLGPTPDDLTRHAIAEAIGRPLEENPEALAQLRTMFGRWRREPHASDLAQALIPAGCRVLANSRGTAPGIGFRREGVQLFALPGVPAEMQAMFDSAVAPALPGRGRVKKTGSARLQCYGISEARLGEILGDLMGEGGIASVGTTASEAVITVHIHARGKNETEAASRLADIASQIRNRLGRVVFGQGEETLQQSVAGLLLREGRTVATAESCTGGLLAKQMTDVPGSSAYFRQGVIAYANEAKVDLLKVDAALIERCGAVSEDVARAMASQCRLRAGTDYALSITGIAGPSGGATPDKPVGLVYIGLAEAGGVEVRRFLFGEHLTRCEIRDRACKTALNVLRLRLLDDYAD
ncbi:MAG: competence/damage-inducible protein A [Phycisphaerae bacterium]